VTIYRPGQQPETLHKPDVLVGEGPIADFRLEAERFWAWKAATQVARCSTYLRQVEVFAYCCLRSWQVLVRHWLHRKSRAKRRRSQIESKSSLSPIISAGGVRNFRMHKYPPPRNAESRNLFISCCKITSRTTLLKINQTWISLSMCWAANFSIGPRSLI